MLTGGCMMDTKGMQLDMHLTRLRGRRGSARGGPSQLTMQCLS
jgi:hypothetical protein